MPSVCSVHKFLTVENSCYGVSAQHIGTLQYMVHVCIGPRVQGLNADVSLGRFDGLHHTPPHLCLMLHKGDISSVSCCGLCTVVTPQTEQLKVSMQEFSEFSGKSYGCIHEVCVYYKYTVCVKLNPLVSVSPVTNV